MKNMFVFALMIATILSCNTNTSTTKQTETSSHAAYAPSEGDVTSRNGKVMVWKDGEWKEADTDVHLNGGIVVNRRGEVIRGDKIVVLKDGEVVDRSGRFFDKAGNAIDDAWDATKKGVKKVGEEVKDVFHDDHNKDKDDKK
jgi:hypothetical protein